MRKTFLLIAVAALLGFSASAKEPQPGTIVSENSVACGTQVKKKKETTSLLCQEYVVRSDSTEYHIRQQKHASQAIIPVNTPIEFTLDKDKMKFKANGKSYEYLVVSETPVAPQQP